MHTHTPPTCAHAYTLTAAPFAACPITNSPCYGDAVFANLLPGEGYTPLYRHWYWYKPAKEGRSFWTDPYLDEGGANVPIITYSVPIHRAGVFVGVATMDVALAPGSTMGQPQSLDVDEESVAGGEYQSRCHFACTLMPPFPFTDEGMSSESKAGVVSAAAAAKGKRKLEQLAKLPQAAARQLSDHLSSRPDVVSEVFVRQLLKGVMKGDGVFGACVAFEPNVFNGMQDKSFYVKRSEPATAPTPAAPAVVGVGEESKAPPLLPPCTSLPGCVPLAQLSVSIVYHRWVVLVTHKCRGVQGRRSGCTRCSTPPPEQLL